MAKYVLLEDVLDCISGDNMEGITDLPTCDIVRCKDCAIRYQAKKRCDYWNCTTDDNDFCFYGTPTHRKGA